MTKRERKSDRLPEGWLEGFIKARKDGLKVSLKPMTSKAQRTSKEHWLTWSGGLWRR